MADIEVNTTGGEGGLIHDRDDWLWFVAGGLAALVALYLVKNILEPQHTSHHHWHPHISSRPRPIAREIEKGTIYHMDNEGKYY